MHQYIIFSGSKYVLNPELRARRIVNISQYASVDFCKQFWFLGENGNVCLVKVSMWLSLGSLYVKLFAGCINYLVDEYITKEYLTLRFKELLLLWKCESGLKKI